MLAGFREACAMPGDRTCTNCHNRHGCRTPDPPCLALERLAGEAGLPGKAVLARRGRLPLCRECGFFRQCWAEADYLRASRPRGPAA
jgi:hypothetical protein